MRRRRFFAGGMVVIACVPLIACNAPDWRPAAIADAEGKVRQEISDPAAQFTRVQITGDSKTGRTCGYTTANVGAFGMQHTLRFIVYIDATAGPFVEAGMGQHPVSQQDFDRDWQSDCVNEGYRA